MADNQAQAEETPSGLHQQKVSGILRAVLDEEEPAESSGGRRLSYPWFVDVILALGLLVAVGGFAFGLFKMYITHKAHQCMIQGDYKGAIRVLKESPFPSMSSLMTLRDEDPEELLAQALYTDAMHKINDDNDMEGAKLELQQIKAGTSTFASAQQILADNFQPSDTQLTGGVVQNATGK